MHVRAHVDSWTSWPPPWLGANECAWYNLCMKLHDSSTAKYDVSATMTSTKERKKKTCLFLAFAVCSRVYCDSATVAAVARRKFFNDYDFVRFQTKLATTPSLPIMFGNELRTYDRIPKWWQIEERTQSGLVPASVVNLAFDDLQLHLYENPGLTNL